MTNHLVDALAVTLMIGGVVSAGGLVVTLFDGREPPAGPAGLALGCLAALLLVGGALLLRNR